MNKLELLLGLEGYEALAEFIEERGADSVVPGICMNSDCDFTANVEPDQTKGWCEYCETNTVRSIIILIGAI